MKNSRRCPKCGSADVARCKSVARGAYDQVPAGAAAKADVERWICCACGYCELWADPAKLDQLREFWGPPEKP